jgi:hypothetical protein
VSAAAAATVYMQRSRALPHCVTVVVVLQQRQLLLQVHGLAKALQPVQQPQRCSCGSCWHMHAHVQA